MYQLIKYFSVKFLNFFLPKFLFKHNLKKLIQKNLHLLYQHLNYSFKTIF